MTKEQWIELADRLDCIEAETLEGGDALFQASEAIRNTFGEHQLTEDPTVKALRLAVKHLNDLEEFCGPNRPCCDPDAECPISMGEWFTRQDKEELATIRAALPRA